MPIENITLIGAGNMARGLIGGLKASGFDAAAITVADPVDAQLKQVAAQFAVRTTGSNRQAVALADLIVLAVKPQEMVAVLTEIGPSLPLRDGKTPLIVSVAAGIRTDTILRVLGGPRRVIRAMPNRPALVGKGITALFAAPGLTPSERSAVEAVLGAVGETVWVEREEQMDAVTAVSGSGPAYFFLLIELLESAAREQGLAADVARKLSVETAYGAASMARGDPYPDPAQLRADVTSKGGTTAAALAVLETADLRNIVSRAVAAATQRSAQLAAENTKD